MCLHLRLHRKTAIGTEELPMLWHRTLIFSNQAHEPYVVIASGDGVYKMDYAKVLEYHIAKKADITIVTSTVDERDDPSRFGVINTDADGRVTDFEEKPITTDGRQVSTGIYIIRRRQLIELIEKAAEEERHDFVTDILIRYKMSRRYMLIRWIHIGAISHQLILITIQIWIFLRKM